MGWSSEDSGMKKDLRASQRLTGRVWEKREPEQEQGLFESVWYASGCGLEEADLDGDGSQSVAVTVRRPAPSLAHPGTPGRFRTASPLSPAPGYASTTPALIASSTHATQLTTALHRQLRPSAETAHAAS